MIFVFLLVGFGLLLVGAEVLVRGASRLAAAIGMSQLVIGLTVVALGTSSPEFAVSLKSAFSGTVELAIGNAVGSNILNTLLILGICSLVIPLTVEREIMRVDYPFMVAATLATYLLALDGTLSRLDGVLLFGSIIVYMSWLVWSTQRKRKRDRKERLEKVAASGTGEIEDEAILSSPRTIVKSIVMVIVGLAMLIYGCDTFVNACVTLAESLGVSQLMIGLTVVALGTSLPELLTCLVAAWRGHRDIAVGNVVGSNIFNLLGVLGLTSVVAPAGLPVATEALRVDMPVALAAVLIGIPICITGWRISRAEGALLTLAYVAYLVYLIMTQQAPAQ